MCKISLSIICAFISSLLSAQDTINQIPSWVFAMKDSCKAQYDLSAIQALDEQLKGKQVWLADPRGHIEAVYKRTAGSNQNFRWLESTGSCYQSYSNGLLWTSDNFSGMSCIFCGIRLLPNMQIHAFLENPESDRMEDRIELTPGRYKLLDFANRQLYYGSQFFPKNRFEHEKWGPMYKYYAIFVVNPTKTYTYQDHHGSPIIDIPTNLADTLYIPYRKYLYKYIMTNDQFETAMKRFKEWSHEQWAAFNETATNEYNYAKQQWGEGIADKIRRGIVEFGFTSEMCLMARRHESYFVDKKMTPFGMAKTYKFLDSDETFLFIDDRLIGIQEKNRKVRYFQGY